MPSLRPGPPAPGPAALGLCLLVLATEAPKEEPPPPWGRWDAQRGEGSPRSHLRRVSA